METEALGVDIGNVISNHRVFDLRNSSEYEKDYSSVPESEGAFEALATLAGRFGDRRYLVSKCTEEMEEKLLTWLSDNDFHAKTGIPREHVYFCRERSDKSAICASLGITHFMDNRLEVLSHMIGNVPHLYLYRPYENEVAQFASFLPQVTRVESWHELTRLLA